VRRPTRRDSTGVTVLPWQRKLVAPGRFPVKYRKWAQARFFYEETEQ
jgi:hypothetical protein